MMREPVFSRIPTLDALQAHAGVLVCSHCAALVYGTEQGEAQHRRFHDVLVALAEGRES